MNKIWPTSFFAFLEMRFQIWNISEKEIIVNFTGGPADGLADLVGWAVPRRHLPH